MAEANEPRYYRPDPIPADLDNPLARWVDEQLRRLEIATGATTITLYETKVEQGVQDGRLTDLEQLPPMRMLAPYAPGTAVPWGTVVFDAGWTMHANKDTSDRAAPQPQGTPAYYYDGTIGSTAVLAKQVMFGTRYLFSVGGYITGYRIDVVAGNSYRIFSIQDPNGDAILSELTEFVATADGWTEFGLGRILVAPGFEFDLVGIVSEPDPTPTVWIDQWNYTTPQNNGVPAAGVIIQANSSAGVMRISYQSSTQDRTADLQALTIGDVIHRGDSSWAVQSLNDGGTYIEFGVSPAVQSAPDGVADVSFETVTATAITYGIETDKWLGNASARGLLVVDGDYGDAVPDDNAYGTDIELQAASVSPDWDLVSLPPT